MPQIANAPAWTSLGYALLRVSRFHDANVSFHRALAIDPSLTLARAGLQQAASR